MNLHGKIPFFLDKCVTFLCSCQGCHGLFEVSEAKLVIVAAGVWLVVLC